MTIDITNIVDENVEVTLTYAAGDPFSGTETISFAGMAITADGDTAEEKTEVKEAFKEAIKGKVARHLRTKLANVPKEASAPIQYLADNWTKDVANVTWFANNNGLDEV